MRSRWRHAALTMVVGLALGLVGCSGDGRPVISGDVTIAASPALSDAIKGMIHAFTTTYPSVRFGVVFEPDSTIAELATRTPPPDLIVAEDPDTLRQSGITTGHVPFARGQLVLAVPSGNPMALRDIADVARPEVRVALCDVAEPCGAVTERVLAEAEVTPGTPLYEPDVRSALSRVTQGSADAALVYRSDALTAEDLVMAIEFLQSSAALTDFVAAVPATAPNPTVAQAFLDYLASEPVRDALTRDGFRPID